MSNLENYASFALQKQNSLYPFCDTAPLLTNTDVAFPHNMFVDMRAVICGDVTQVYLSRLEIVDRQSVFTFQNHADTLRMTASVSVSEAGVVETILQLKDGTAVGFLYVDTAVLRRFLAENNLATTFIFPAKLNVLLPLCLHFHPYTGVRFKMPDGEIVTGPVVLLGESGVVLRYGFVLDRVLTHGYSTDRVEVLRVDFTGEALPADPDCDRVDVATPRVFLEDLGGATRDSFGNIQITAQRFAGGTALKIDTDPQNSTIKLYLAGVT